MSTKNRRNKHDLSEGDKKLLKLSGSAVVEKEKIIKEKFINDSLLGVYKCSSGLTISLSRHQGHRILAFSINHIASADFVHLFKRGKLIDEVKLLCALAYLPFGTPYYRRLHRLNCYILDAVSIDLDEAFNVFDANSWDDNTDVAMRKALSILRSGVDPDECLSRLKKTLSNHPKGEAT